MNQIEPGLDAFIRDIAQFDHLNGSKKYLAQLKKAYGEHFSPQWPKTVWHYTPFNSFKSIVSKQEFWFTHVSSQEDKDEVQRVADTAREILCDAINNGGFPARSSTMLARARDGLLTNRAQSFWYTSSYTGKSDSPSHWKEYGDNFRGVSMEFDPNALTAFLNTSPSDQLFAGQMIYSTIETKRFMIKLILLADHNFTKDFSEISDDQIAADEFMKIWGNHAEVYSVLPKLEKFAVEDEWRLARPWPWTGHPPGLIIQDGKRRWPTGRGKDSNNQHQRLPITQIKIGSLASTTLEDDVSNVLENAGYKGVPISRSTASA
jgi:Protein of unknown function (DUF2971)